jgi:hypothetical protein
MKRAWAFALTASLLAAPVCAEESAVRSIAYARWVDIGPGRSMAQLKPAEIAALRRCKDWTMYFQPAGDGIAQTFVAGMTMSNTFPKVLVSRVPGETIFVLAKPNGKTSDTLHLSKDGMVLTQISPPFRPHTYLRCAEPAKKR